MGLSMIHLNDNLLCAVDIETTGTKAGFHDIIEICVLPLDAEIKPSQKFLPFNLYLRPKRPENIDLDAVKVNKIVLAEIMLNGMEAYAAADLFSEWFEGLKLLPGKRISPLGQNWVFDRNFLIDWLGQVNFDYHFDARYRDTMVCALFENDVADHRVEQVPYPKVTLQYLASCLKIEATGRKHRALDDCVTTAEIYRRMLHVRF